MRIFQLKDSRGSIWKMTDGSTNLVQKITTSRGIEMKLGMLHLFENPIDKSENQIIKEQMEIMLKSEEFGFDSVWPAEHHFSEYGIMGAPQVPLAAIAVKTTKIRLGTGVIVLPFHNPIRVAEDFAFLDHLSDGRVIFGVGRGYQPSE